MPGPIHEGPDDHDADLFSDLEDVMDCPSCNAEIYAYAEQCPECGVWLTMRHREVKGHRGESSSSVRTIIIVLIILSMLAWIFI